MQYSISALEHVIVLYCIVILRIALYTV